MSLTKITVAVAAALLAFGAYTAQANQVTDGTYTFTATDGNTYLDGSWVKFSGDNIVDWFLNDSKVDAATQQFPTTALPLTSSNSHLAAIGVYGANQWYFIIDGNNINVNYYDFFEGQNNLNGQSALYVGFGDPIGTWTAGVSTRAVPDASSTLPMLAGAMTILGAYRKFGRARSAKK